MALPVQTVWEVRTTGNDANGGGFVAGSGGTDYSQQAAAQVTYTDLVINATTNTNVTSAAFPFGAAHVGNILNITGGTGFTVGRYQVVSVAGAVATLDRAVGTLSSTGGAGKLGGALASIGTLASSMVASNRAYIASGTYTVTAETTFGQAAISPGPTVTPSHLVGYNAARGDITPSSANQANRPLISQTTNGANVLTFTNGGWRVENLQVAPGGSATAINNGILFGGGNCAAINCKVSSAQSNGIAASNGDSAIEHCEITGMVGGTAINTSFNACVRHNWVHDCTGSTTAILGGNSTNTFSFNVISNIAGASGIGIVCAAGAKVLHNTIYNCGSDGIQFNGQPFRDLEIKGNLVANCTGYGLNSTTAGIAASALWDGNAFFSNTAGNVAAAFNDTTVNPINAISPYTYQYNAILTASPFVNAAGNDFRLNSNAGGGAACRAVGLDPATWPGLAGVTSYADFGAVQHQDASGGGVSRGRAQGAC